MKKNNVYRQVQAEIDEVEGRLEVKVPANRVRVEWNVVTSQHSAVTLLRYALWSDETDVELVGNL